MVAHNIKLEHITSENYKILYPFFKETIKKPTIINNVTPEA